MDFFNRFFGKKKKEKRKRKPRYKVHKSKSPAPYISLQHQLVQAKKAFAHMRISELVEILIEAPAQSDWREAHLAGGTEASHKTKDAWTALTTLYHKQPKADELLSTLLQYIEVEQYVQYHRAFAVCEADAIKILLPYLASDNKHAKLNALNALAEMDCPQAIDEILLLIYDNDIDIRKSALLALASTKHPKALAAIKTYKKWLYPLLGIRFDYLQAKVNVPRQIQKYTNALNRRKSPVHKKGFPNAERDLDEMMLTKLQAIYAKYWQD